MVSLYRGYGRMRTKKKNYKTEVRTMKSIYWYYKGSDIIGEGRREKGWVDYGVEKNIKKRLSLEEIAIIEKVSYSTLRNRLREYT